MSKRTKINPELKRGEKEKLNRHWRGLFLDCLAETSNVSEAARRAEINPSRAYKVRREESDFAKLWHLALVEGYEHLELELLARLRAGEAKDGPKHDNGAALRLLTLHRDAMAQEHAHRRNLDEASARALAPSIWRTKPIPLAPRQYYSTRVFCRYRTKPIREKTLRRLRLLA